MFPSRYTIRVAADLNRESCNIEYNLNMDGAEVAKHNTRSDCWIVLEGSVYDVTDFLPEHPGGPTMILKYAGGDATEEFHTIHSIDIVHDLPKEKHLGPLKSGSESSLQQPVLASKQTSNEDETPDVSLMTQLNDFEAAAKPALSPRSWIYASSSANSGLSLANNIASWTKLSFRPRIMRDVANVTTETSILRQKSRFPFFVSPMGTLGVVHSDAELELVRGVVRSGVSWVLSTASTKTPEEVMGVYKEEQQKCGNASPSILYFQLYVHVERKNTQALLKRVQDLGFKGLFITVDTAVIGKRTADRRLQAQEAIDAGVADETDTLRNQTDKTTEDNDTFAPPAPARPRPGQITPSLNWNDLKWIREVWKGPIVLKGIQTVDDALLAVEHGVDGILLSNHGGRQLHTAPSALETLLEIRMYAPQVIQKVEVFLDGGCRDGADALKAIALGARAVGIGRPYLYALAAYGAKGVARVTDIMGEEMETAMRLMGATSLDQLKPGYVNTRRLENEVWTPLDSHNSRTSKL